MTLEKYEEYLQGARKEIIRAALEVGALKVRMQPPFTWASGYKMPVYNDNRLLLSSSITRRIIAKTMSIIIQQRELAPDCIAGVATSGIPLATSLADLMELPLCYVRSKAKEHGMGNKVEGAVQAGQTAVVVEDLLSTGGSAFSVVQTLRELGLEVPLVVSVFSYELPTLTTLAAETKVEVQPILTFRELLAEMRESKLISEAEVPILERWLESPYTWWEKEEERISKLTV